MNLDVDFGRLLPPRPRAYVSPSDGGYDAWERFSPSSLVVLNHQSGTRLRSLMKQIEDGCPVGQTLMNDVLFIWLVDEIGRILLALEELVVNATPVHVPKFQTLNVTVSRDKLGHPSLISCDRARIAGEIRYRSAASGRNPFWIINNASGRYGLYSDRTKSQLENAAKQFSAHKIPLTVDFIKPK